MDEINKSKANIFFLNKIDNNSKGKLFINPSVAALDLVNLAVKVLKLLLSLFLDGLDSTVSLFVGFLALFILFNLHDLSHLHLLLLEFLKQIVYLLDFGEFWV
jgi:hypothetical protein